jgi:hypothetical protein
MARINTSKLERKEPKRLNGSNEIHRYVSKAQHAQMTNVHIHELKPNIIQYIIQ